MSATLQKVMDKTHKGHVFNPLQPHNAIGRRTGLPIIKKRNTHKGITAFDDFLTDTEDERSIDVTTLSHHSVLDINEVQDSASSAEENAASRARECLQNNVAVNVHQLPAKNFGDVRVVNPVALGSRIGRRTGKDVLAVIKAKGVSARMNNFSDYLSDSETSESLVATPSISSRGVASPSPSTSAKESDESPEKVKKLKRTSTVCSQESSEAVHTSNSLLFSACNKDHSLASQNNALELQTANMFQKPCIKERTQSVDTEEFSRNNSLRHVETQELSLKENKIVAKTQELSKKKSAKNVDTQQSFAKEDAKYVETLELSRNENSKDGKTQELYRKESIEDLNTQEMSKKKDDKTQELSRKESTKYYETQELSRSGSTKYVETQDSSLRKSKNSQKSFSISCDENAKITKSSLRGDSKNTETFLNEVAQNILPCKVLDIMTSEEVRIERLPVLFKEENSAIASNKNIVSFDNGNNRVHVGNNEREKQDEEEKEQKGSSLSSPKKEIEMLELRLDTHTLTIPKEVYSSISANNKSNQEVTNKSDRVMQKVSTRHGSSEESCASVVNHSTLNVQANKISIGKSTLNGISLKSQNIEHQANKNKISVTSGISHLDVDNQSKTAVPQLLVSAVEGSQVISTSEDTPVLLPSNNLTKTHQPTSISKESRASDEVPMSAAASLNFGGDAMGSVSHSEKAISGQFIGIKKRLSYSTTLGDREQQKEENKKTILGNREIKKPKQMTRSVGSFLDHHEKVNTEYPARVSGVGTFVVLAPRRISQLEAEEKQELLSLNTSSDSLDEFHIVESDIEETNNPRSGRKKTLDERKMQPGKEKTSKAAQRKEIKEGDKVETVSGIHQNIHDLNTGQLKSLHDSSKTTKRISDLSRQSKSYTKPDVLLMDQHDKDGISHKDSLRISSSFITLTSRRVSQLVTNKKEAVILDKSTDCVDDFHFVEEDLEHNTANVDEAGSHNKVIKRPEKGRGEMNKERKTGSDVQTSVYELSAEKLTSTGSSGSLNFEQEEIQDPKQRKVVKRSQNKNISLSKKQKITEKKQSSTTDLSLADKRDKKIDNGVVNLLVATGCDTENYKKQPQVMEVSMNKLVIVELEVENEPVDVHVNRELSTKKDNTLLKVNNEQVQLGEDTINNPDMKCKNLTSTVSTDTTSKTKHQGPRQSQRLRKNKRVENLKTRSTAPGSKIQQNPGLCSNYTNDLENNTDFSTLLDNLTSQSINKKGNNNNQKKRLAMIKSMEAREEEQTIPNTENFADNLQHDINDHSLSSQENSIDNFRILSNDRVGGVAYNGKGEFENNKQITESISRKKLNKVKNGGKQKSINTKSSTETDTDSQNSDINKHNYRTTEHEIDSIVTLSGTGKRKATDNNLGTDSESSMNTDLARESVTNVKNMKRKIARKTKSVQKNRADSQELNENKHNGNQSIQEESETASSGERVLDFSVPVKLSTGKKTNIKKHAEPGRTRQTSKRKSVVDESQDECTPLKLKLLSSLPKVTPQSGISFRRSRCFTSTYIDQEEASQEVRSPMNLEESSTPIQKQGQGILSSCLKSSDSVRPRRRVRISNIIDQKEFSPLKDQASRSFTDTTTASLLSLSSSPIHYAETTTNNVYSPRIKSPRIILQDLSHKIIRPDENKDGLRRSKRTKVRPLRRDRGEAIIYRRDSTGQGLVVDRIQPSLGEAKVKAAEERRRQKLKQRKLKALSVPAKPAKRLSAHWKVVDEVTNSTEIPVVNPDNNEQVLLELISRQSNNIPWYGPDLEPTVGTESVAMSIHLKQPLFTTGEIHMGPLAEKPLEITTHTLIFNVLYGKVHLTINDVSTTVETGDDFFIPRGTCYSMKNLRREIAKLHFTNLNSAT